MVGSVRVAMAVLLVLLMVAGIAGYAGVVLAERSAPVAGASGNSGSGSVSAEAWKWKVSPELLKAEAYAKRGHLPVGTSVEEALEAAKSMFAKRLPSNFDGKRRVIVYFTGGDRAIQAIRSIAPVTSGVRLEGGSSGYLIVWADRAQVEELAKLPYVMSIVPDLPMNPPKPRVDSLYEQESGNPSAQIYGAVDIMNATYAWSQGYKGEGVKVAVVDTGVDMGETDLGPSALARDEMGRPLLFDADEVGLVLTLNTATYAGNGTVYIQPLTIGNYSGIVYYDGYDGSLYITNFSLMLVYDTSTGNYTVIPVPVANSYYGVPPEVTNNSVVHFGLASQNLYVGNFFVWYLAPVISVDLDGDGVFDGAYIDISTTYFLFTYALYQLGYNVTLNTTYFDLSFADEQLLNYNNPVAARDFTGDGVNDFSLGAIAGAFNDANGVFGGAYSFDWLNDFETIGYVLPGYDSSYGMFLDLEFDFHSHGTYCAHVIAGRGKVPRPLGYGDIYYKLPGVAPNASIGGASALWNGNVITAELYLSGFYPIDPANFTWAYTGWTHADVISNSWGSSYLIINGYASDADPTSLWEDLITLYSGTVIVHAAGNGGPGYGSVTMAGTATSVITAGASTEFLYRPVYNYLPGAWDQVVSWSDRGPTQFAYPKPDVVNVGSFAWSVGRVIDGLGNGVYAFDLFGGTSEATPMTAGAVALLIQALKDHGYTVTPGIVKALLKNSARNLGYDPFSQGAGHVDLYKAIREIQEGGYVVATDAPYKVSKYFDDTMATMIGASKDFIQSLFMSDADTSLYFGVVKPGETGTASATFTSLSGGAAPVSGDFHLVTLKRTGSLSIASAVDLSKAVLIRVSSSGVEVLPVPNKYVAILGNYIFIRLDELGRGSRLLLPLKPSAVQALENSDLAEINAYYPYKFMDPYGRNGNYSWNFIMGVETSYWIDYDGNMIPFPSETARIQYDIRLGNAFHVQIGKPAKAFKLAEKVALDYLQEYYGINASNAYKAPVIDVRFFYNNYYGIGTPIVMPLKTEIDLYKQEAWNWPFAYTINGSTVTFQLTVPTGTKPGVYEGYVKIANATGYGEIYLPVSVAVPLVVSPGVPAVVTGGGNSLYNNYVFRGALDQSWRPETGDWRIYPVVVEGNTFGRIVALKVGVSWANPASSFDVAVNGPGYNFWGVGNTSYTAWVDAATVAAKISAVSQYLGANGVYTYFDWPSNRYSEVIAPVAPTIYDPDASTYWIVVHQIFQAYTPDQVTLRVIPLTLSDNIITLREGGSAYKVVSFFSSNLGNATRIAGPVVMPLYGSGGVYVSVMPANLTAAPLKHFAVAAYAGNGSSGAYLVLTLYASNKPSVIWGGQVGGSTYILYTQPTIFFATFLVSVSP